MDLTQYHQAYKLKFEATTGAVEKAINDYNKRTCCAGCDLRIKLGMDGNLSRHKIDSLNDMMSAMLWSSGFLSSIEVSKKKNCDYIVKLYMRRMTDEQKKDNLALPDDMEQSDPVTES